MRSERAAVAGAVVSNSGLRAGSFAVITKLHHAAIDGDNIELHGIILKPDGSEAHEARMTGTIGDAEEIGLAMGKRLIAEAGPMFFEGWA